MVRTRARAQVLERARRGDAGGMKTGHGTRHHGVIHINHNAAEDGPVPTDPTNLPGGGDDTDAGAIAAAAVMRDLERCQLHLPRAAVLELVSMRTRLLADFAAHRALTGDHEVARAARAGDVGLLQLLDRGTQDRKDLETLLCAALRCAAPSAPHLSPPLRACDAC